MALGLSTTKTRFRFDSPYLPEITPTGITNTGKLRINFDLYETVANSTPYEYNAPNQTDIKTIELRNVARPTWTLGTNVSLVSSDPKKSTVDSNSGAYKTALNSTNCAIEGKVTATDLRCGISLQSGTADYDKDSSQVEHALILQEDGYLAVYELGVRLEYTLRPYQLDDIVLIDKQGTVIRYLLIRDGVVEILRQTRSKLDDGDIKGVIILYSINSQLAESYIYSNENTSLTIETIGVLENFQDWFNDFSINSTAETLLAQDNNPSFTFPNGKKRIRVINASRNALAGLDDILAFRAFFNYHGIEKDFIFIDRAKIDADENPTWFWARFVSAFSDKTRRACINADQATIQESYRKDIIPLEVPIIIIPDTEPPTIPGILSTFNKSSGSITVEFAASTDNVGVTGYQYRLDGGSWTNLVATGTTTIRGLISGLSPLTTYDIEVRAYDAVPLYSDPTPVHTETTQDELDGGFSTDTFSGSVDNGDSNDTFTGSYDGGTA